MKYLIILLILIYAALELTIGNHFEEIEFAKYKFKKTGLKAADYYKAPAGRIPYPDRPADTTKIIYLSNSHAKTGGNVANHLQHFLSQTAKGKYEVLDMSEPGIFAPEMLERFCAALSFKPDTLILAPAYISFSDRMILKRQSHTARSFFRPEVVSCLPAGFWLRNYDIGLYADTLFSHYSKLYRYRDRIRKEIEKPIKNLLSPDRTSHILEADINKSWQFPDGFDRNLFDWSLYASGRSSHLKDFGAILRKAHEESIYTLVTNLPIDWGKEPRQRNTKDFELYLESLKEVSKSANTYVNYEGTFPKEFSTYDALHPTYHGARLHAYDLYLRIAREHALSLRELSNETFPSYSLSVEACSMSKLQSFVRYDLFEHTNAQKLLCALQNAALFSEGEKNILNNLVRRIRYWKETDFLERYDHQNSLPDHWRLALQSEREYAVKTLSHFTGALASLLHSKHKNYPAVIPDSESQTEEKTFDMPINNSKVLLTHRKYHHQSQIIETLENGSDQRVFAIKVSATNRSPAYIKYDILGDGSFLLTDLNTSKLTIPEWVYSKEIIPDWGT